jgi:dimethylaniline monooxygenase (N-oxide forming) / hypotaurine monooxygenase
MMQAIQQQREKHSRLGAHPVRVQLFEYVDEMATAIGVRPRLVRHPRLLLRMLAGPLTAAQYRLDGPGSPARPT